MTLENEIATVTYQPISEDELISYQIRLKGDIFKQIRKRLASLKSIGFTQRNLAAKLNIDPGQLSRQLSGESDLRLETLADMARGMDCRIHVFLAPIGAYVADRSINHPNFEMYAIGYHWSTTPKPKSPEPHQVSVVVSTTSPKASSSTTGQTGQSVAQGFSTCVGSGVTASGTFGVLSNPTGVFTGGFILETPLLVNRSGD